MWFADTSIHPLEAMVENGIPKTILTDQGSQFISQEFENFMTKNNINHIRSSFYNPTGNSISERINQTIARVIRMNNNLSLTKIVPRIEKALQLCYHRSIDSSPHESRYKWTPLDPLKRIFEFPLEKAIGKTKSMVEKDIIRRNKGREMHHKYKIGDLGMTKRNIRNKYDDYWDGPYKIEKINSFNNLFTISNHFVELRSSSCTNRRAC